jgi:diamine N-acetyltransferase
MFAGKVNFYCSEYMLLQTERIFLKPTIETDLDEILKIEHGNARYIGKYSRDKHALILADKTKVHLSVFEKSTGELVGYAILAGLGDDHDAIEFRRLAISKKGNGYGRDVIRLIKRLCFENLGVHRLWLDVISDNFRALKLYETEGFRKEGLIRDCVKSGEEYRSIWVMALLEDEYLSLKQPV